MVLNSLDMQNGHSEIRNDMKTNHQNNEIKYHLLKNLAEVHFIAVAAYTLPAADFFFFFFFSGGYL